MYSEISRILKEHNEMMRRSIPLIASENITSALVRKCYLSDFGHRYAEGKVGERYYTGCRFIDEVEKIAMDLTEKLFEVKHVNVQPISGVVANLAAFFALTNPDDVILSISVPCGGHISHDKLSAAGLRGLRVVYYPFSVDAMNVDAEATEKLAKDVKPKLFILGSSLILRRQPVKEIREIADKLDAYVMFDASHVLGLIAGKTYPNPIRDGADVVTASTHKTFFGPQRGLILSNERVAKRVDRAVFPGVVSNHHLHSLAGYAVAAMEMLNFGESYAKQIVRNAKGLSEALYNLGYKVLGESFGFTETHQIAVDVREFGGGDRVAKKLEEVGILLNKNLLPWDSIEMSSNPSGIRIGVQEVTRLGMREDEMIAIAEFIDLTLRERKSFEKIRKEITDFRKNFQTVKFTFEECDAYEIC
ncbi:MAG: serine hydroxymethyltransferase [Archaeoglobaceae archaeon]|nr:serine hydroxymethyltransferase [Archaeoglobaceae archaeon]MDW8117610.1 serine hydroxymethyltransferase [Archaeoglobaceae archaeon]